MTIDLERIKFELLSAYKSAGSIDIAWWVGRFPSHRDEILEFWLWARGGGDQPDESPGNGLANLRSIADDALHRACLAVSLGPEWLKPLVVEAEAQRIAEQVRELGKQSPPKTLPGRRSFRRAVVCAWVVNELSDLRNTVSRLALQKTTYLLENALTLNLFDEHRQKPLGPYDHTARYKDAEPIAAKKGWITIVGSTLEAGQKSSEFEKYIGRYLRSADLARTLVRLFGQLTDEQLETWATVHWLARRIASTEPDVTTRSIREALNRDRQWSPKMQRPNFSEDRIREALDGLRKLGLLTVR